MITVLPSCNVASMRPFCSVTPCRATCLSIAPLPSWASALLLFQAPHCHLARPPFCLLMTPQPPSIPPNHAIGSQLNVAVLRWVLQNFIPSISQPLDWMNPVCEMWLNLETIYATNTSFECMFSCYEVEDSLDDRFDRLQEFIQE